MRRLVTTLLAITLLAGTANAQVKRKYPPGPPYRTCPDTLKIYDVEQPDTTLAPCHPAQYSPASGDTVLGIKGIVTGFDAKPSAFGFYIQNSQGGPFTGVQVFTGAYNWNAGPYNLALGDSVAVYGTTQEFPSGAEGTTEIEGPDVIQSTNDIIIRKISSGNPLPRFQILTTTTMSWIPSGTPHTQEQWEGGLVRIRGPLRVGRNSTQNGRPGLPFGSFLVVSVASPSDSVLIDGNTLATFTPPATGTLIDSIQGIVNQATSGTPTFTSYRIQIRNSDDVIGSFSTALVDAYPIADTFVGPQTGQQDGPRPRIMVSNETLRLDFDRVVETTSAQNTANYSLASGIDGSTVDAATVTNGGRGVDLAITSVRTDGDQETVTASGIGTAGCGACPLTPNQNRTFINGVLTVKQAQQANPDSLAASICSDRSRFAGTGAAPGTRISLRGVGVGAFGSLQYLEDSDAANRSGISIFGPSAFLNLGERYLVAGQIQEFGSETEIVNNVFLQQQGAPGIPPVRAGKDIRALTDSTCDAAGNIDNGEDKEGMLVKIVDLRVTKKYTTKTTGTDSDKAFFAAGPCCTFDDTILVSNLNGVLTGFVQPDSGSIVDVTGILHFASGTFRICPRTMADVFKHAYPTGVGEGLSAKVEFSAFPNPARSTQISFSLPRKDDVELGIYDVLGRRVAVLARGKMPAGAYSKRWDGLDDNGNKAGPGVYFLRLKVGTEVYRLRSVMLQ